MSTNTEILNLAKRDILCPYCRSKFMIELPKEGIGIKIVKCPFCNKRTQILQNKENITLYTVKKNKDRTWKEILEMCINLSDKFCWDYITSLRGPDFDNKLIKVVFTCPLRGKVDPQTMDVVDYKALSFEDIEKAFIEVSKNINKYGHYILHIQEAWYKFNPRIANILEDLYIINAMHNFENFAKDLALKYKEYLDEWLESEKIIIK